jgi:uncharacterized protein YuzE
VRPNEEVALNIRAREKIGGIEIFEAQNVLGSGKAPPVTLEVLEPATAPI